MSKVDILKKWLVEEGEYSKEEIEDIDVQKTEWDENTFEVGNREYMVLTDTEADERTQEDIKDTAWAFNADFIIEHSSVLDYDKGSYQIIKAIQEQCENGNDAMLKLIDDFDEFVEDAVDADGRGHFLNTYDGKEHEFYDEDGKDYYIYRMN